MANKRKFPYFYIEKEPRVEKPQRRCDECGECKHDSKFVYEDVDICSSCF